MDRLERSDRNALLALRRTVFKMALATFLLLTAQTADVAAGQEPSDYQPRPAHFVVKPDVVNADLMPFTATIGRVGNSIGGRRTGGFEPSVWRNLHIATEDSPDRFIAGPGLAHNDTLGERALEGGEIRIYRFRDGKMHRVRSEAILEGGFHLSGWLMETQRNTIIPTGRARLQYRFGGSYKPGRPYYFCVRAVDSSGNESAGSNVVDIVPPEKTPDRLAENLEPFRARRREDDDPPPAPRNLKAEVDEATGAVAFAWEEPDANDLAGYRLYMSYFPPEKQKGFYVDLGEPESDSERVRQGDWAIVSRKFYFASRDMFSPRFWGGEFERDYQPSRLRIRKFLEDGGLDQQSKPTLRAEETPGVDWKLVPHGDADNVPNGGETCIRLDLHKKITIEACQAPHAGTGQQYYDTLELDTDYVVEFWLRGEGGEDSVAVWDRLYPDAINARFTPTKEWRQCSFTFRLSKVDQGSSIGSIKLLVTGPGTFHLDSFRIYRKDVPYLDLLPRDYQALQESRMAALRTHAFVKTKTDTYDMVQLTNAAGQMSECGGNTLPQTLSIMRKAGTQPWLQIEWHMSEQEWLGLVEYLAAPYDPAVDTPAAKPWACKRFSQGQKRPWTEEFDRIFMELGNETWNWSFKPFVFRSAVDAATGEQIGRGQVYGLWQEYVHATMASSPYWDASRLDDKIAWIVGSQVRSKYGHEAMRVSPYSDYCTENAYMGGWDRGEGPPKADPFSFFSVLSQVNQASMEEIARAWNNRRQIAESTGRARYPLGVYEGGPGYAHPKLRRGRGMTPEDIENQERTMKSQVGGTATLDNFLLRAYYDYDIQNFFTFNRNRYRWCSHAKVQNGGQAYPPWMGLTMFNRYGTGDMLAVQTLQAPTADLPPWRRRSGMDDAPLAACYATRKGDRVTLFVLSRKFPGYPVAGDDGYTECTIELPFTRCESLTLYRMAGDPTAHNLDAKNVEFERVELAAESVKQRFTVDEATGANRRGLPPASTFIYVFEGTDTPEGRTVTPQFPTER